MRIVFRAILTALGCLIFTSAILLPSRFAQDSSRSTVPPASANSNPTESSKALRLNTLGVAYLNQQRPADAQKLFEQALQADPKFAVARLNLGISLLNQQKAEAARDALLAAAQQLPNDAYAWVHLGLAYKDLGDLDHGVAAFEHVTQILPDEADAYYFVGYLNSQLQKYDQAIAAYQKGLALFPYHASSEFGIARAYRAKAMPLLPANTSPNFKTSPPTISALRLERVTEIRAGFRWPSSSPNTSPAVPPAIPVHFGSENIDSLLRGSAQGIFIRDWASTGACFFDFDEDGKPDLFLVSATAQGTSRLLHNIGGGRFEDVSEQSGLKLSGSGWAVPPVILITMATRTWQCVSPMACIYFTIAQWQV